MTTYGERAYAFLEQLSVPRTSGSPQEHAAAQLIAEKIKTLGFTPVLEPFEVRRRLPVRAEFSITAPETVSYTVTGLIDAQETPEEGVDAEFYYLELIDEIGLKRAKGKFVLLNERPKEEDYKKLVDAGIAGFLLMNGTTRDTLENSDLDTMRFRDCYQRYGAVPAFAIRIKDALDMLRRKPTRVHFTLRLEEAVTTSYNVVTEVSGTDLAEESLAVGAHYDSTEFSYGAWDNGAGVVQVLGLLEHLAQHPPRRTVKAILFGSEEIGLRGSRAYLTAHPDEQEQLLAMVNLDVGGNILGKYIAVVTATPAVEAYVQGLLKEAGHSAKVSSHVMSSDSAVFSDYGIPSINLGRMGVQGGGYMHTRYDNMDMIAADVLDEEIRVLIFLMDRLTQAEQFPIAREISAELQEQIVNYFGTGRSHTETVKTKKH